MDAMTRSQGERIASLETEQRLFREEVRRELEALRLEIRDEKAQHEKTSADVATLIKRIDVTLAAFDGGRRVALLGLSVAGALVATAGAAIKTALDAWWR